MRVVVVGATGLIGSRTVARLRDHGVEVAPVSRGDAVDVSTGQGRKRALRGADVIVDVTDAPHANRRSARVLHRLGGPSPQGRRRGGRRARRGTVGGGRRPRRLGLLPGQGGPGEPGTARERLWSAIGRALTPDGSLFLQLPPARLPVRTVVRVLADKRVGEHIYGGRMTMSAAGYRIRTRVDYWVRNAENVLRSARNRPAAPLVT